MSPPKRCPRCWASRVQLPLQRGQTGTFALHACPQCGGVWLDSEASQRVLADSPTQPTGQGPSLFCPCCDQPMTPDLVQPSGVVVDRCDADGVWFDAHELDQICAAAAKRKGITIPARAAVVAGATGSAVLAAAAAGAATAVAVAEMQPSSSPSTHSAAEDIAFDVAASAPDAVYFGAEAAGGAVSDAVGVADLGDATDGASEVGGAAVEGAGALLEVGAEAGSTALDVVTGLLGALFD